MKIRRIHIENFRSIKKLDFEPGKICALVGENGAGKSNILAALDLLLGERYPSSRSLDASDYFGHDESRTVFICVEFDDPRTEVEKLWCEFQQYKKDEIWVKYTYKDSPEYASSDIREELPLIFIDAHRDVNKHLSQSRRALFGRILHRLNKQLSDEDKQKLECKFRDTLHLLRTYEFERFEEELMSAFRDQIRHEQKALELEFKAFDPINYYKSINLLLSDGETPVPLVEAGDGMANMAILALFRAYAKRFRNEGILAIEEPELYLHPHAKRNLAKLFRQLADEGSQLFYTTHSSQFVDIEHFDEICLVERKVDEEGDLCTDIRQLSMQDFAHIRKNLFPDIPFTADSIRARYHNLCSLEHSEAFFARKIVVVEGESEEYALPIYAAALDYDFDTFGISIVNARGKTNLDSFYQLYREFKIPVYLIFDSDRGKKPKDFKTSHDYNEILLRMLKVNPEREPEGRITKAFAISDPDFEAEISSRTEDGLYLTLRSEALKELGTRSKAIQARYVANKLVDHGKIPEYACKIIEAIRELPA